MGRMLHMTPNAVRMALNRARKAGKIEDLRYLLENDCMALAVESLQHHLRLQDKEATFKHLEGMGVWKTYAHSRHEGGPTLTLPALQVNVQVAAGAPVIESVPIGVPRGDEPELG
jgi:hypothetical protein